MTDQRSLEIIRQALLFEKRGKSFYSKVADHTEHTAVRDFFRNMADEEQTHIDLLLKHYRSLKEGGGFVADTSEDPLKTATEIMNGDIIAKISGADYESAAIAAAISMEERAVRLYSERAESSGDEEEKKLYAWLAEWEKSHLRQLLEIDRIVTERIWNDNNFWPF